MKRTMILLASAMIAFGAAPAIAQDDSARSMDHCPSSDTSPARTPVRWQTAS